MGLGVPHWNARRPTHRPVTPREPHSDAGFGVTSFTLLFQDGETSKLHAVCHESDTLRKISHTQATQHKNQFSRVCNKTRITPPYGDSSPHGENNQCLSFCSF